MKHDEFIGQVLHRAQLPLSSIVCLSPEVKVKYQQRSEKNDNR